MIRWAVYAMVYAGSALMVYNIYGFIRFARYVGSLKAWQRKNRILNLPILLLILFLLGYLAVGLLGKPDLIVAGILFGGSVFVFVMYKLLNSITRQIIESERLEAELMAAEESNRAKTSFLASVSHEMRTPLNVIIGQDTLALRDAQLRPQTRDSLEKIGRSARHLSSLIDGILDMQRIESGVMTIHSETFTMRDALDQINTLVQAICDEKGLAFETSFAECAARDYVGDATQLKRVLLGILDNAVKYTDAPGTVRFRVDCDRVDGVCVALRFIVSDTGIGIDEAFLPKIFEPFAQEDASSTNRFGGSGMGLTVANSIVRHMGGRIDVESRKDEGSTFTVTVPLSPSEDRAADAGCACAEGCRPPAAEDAPEAEADGRLAGRRILIVDDMPENAEIVSDLLEMEGAITECAENGRVALEMVARSDENHYDAILMDLRMPVMDGLDATRGIRAMDRADARTVPIIALSANALDIDVADTLNAGMNEHLSKPVDADRLYDALAAWIQRSKDRERGEERP